MTTGEALALAGTVGPVCALLGLWLRLRFYRHVYKVGGAEDLEAAAKALEGPLGKAASGVNDRVLRQKKPGPEDGKAAK
ncbi:hypothetical protein FXN61_35340 [Lentzea sp. PSKA42]|uniref:Uncharacterized protein n=1 Tax=Lentzea indica TaxID=2604800 RepID=A0ABX1FTH1_9PSEU|nr:hypothetical protein [Lentzea indica]NKE61753.1 hypothetical protein [Lentzea indica]